MKIPLTDIKDRLTGPLTSLKERVGGKRSLKITLICLVALIFIFNIFFVYVHPDETGIMEVKFRVIPFLRVKRGIQEAPVSTGLNFVIPLVEKIHVLPKNIQVFDLTNFPTEYTQGRNPAPAAHIQTSDGFFVDVDVSIIYRISDPYLTFTTIGPGFLYETNGILPRAEPTLKATLGKLTTEEFYNSPLRFAKMELAKKLLNEELKPKGITVEYVLIRYFVYSQEIQKNIEAKKLMDQLYFTRQSEARSAAELSNVKKTIQEGEANIQVKLEEGKAYVMKRQAEADLYTRTKKSQADLLVKLADAEKTRLKNEALRGSGSMNLVGLEMAKVYEGLDVIILPSDGPDGVNPLNLDKTLRLFEIR